MRSREAQTLPTDRLRAMQLDRLRAQARRLFERVPFYRARMEDCNVTPDDLRTLADIARLPFTSKGDLRETFPWGLLAVDRGEIVSREAIMTRLWESDSFVDENTLTVNVARLRKKLESAGLTDFIRTRKGAGYLVEG